MKKIIFLILTIFVISFFFSCNLDNNGILASGLERTYSDKKNRSYIGLDESEGILYYSTIDGLAQYDLETGDEINLSEDEIFIKTMTQDIAFLYDVDGVKGIVYIDDSVDGKNKVSQEFYFIDLNDENKIHRLQCEINTTNILFREAVELPNGDTPYLLATERQSTGIANDTAYFYSVSILEDPDEGSFKMELEVHNQNFKNFIDNKNGLIQTGEYDTDEDDYVSYGNFYYYDGEDVYEVKFSGYSNQAVGSRIKSVYATENYLYVICFYLNDSYRLDIFRGSIPYSSSDSDPATITLERGTYISATYNSEFPSFVEDDASGEATLYFLKYNSSTYSRKYEIKWSGESNTDASYDGYERTTTGLEAQRFFKYDGDIYMLTRNKGVQSWS